MTMGRECSNTSSAKTESLLDLRDPDPIAHGLTRAAVLQKAVYM